MKNTAICLIFLLIMALGGASAATAQSGFTPVYVNGVRINVFPVIKDGVVFLPPYTMAQSLGASIKYDYSLNILKINDIMVSATPYTPPDGQILVPAEALCQTIGGSLEWDGQTRAIRITTPRSGATVAQPYSPPPMVAQAPTIPSLAPISPTITEPTGPSPSSSSKSAPNPYQAQEAPFQPQAAPYQPSNSAPNPYQAQTSSSFPPPPSGSSSLSYYPSGIIPITTPVTTNNPPYQPTAPSYNPPAAGNQAPAGSPQTTSPQDTMNYNPTMPQTSFPSGSIYQQPAYSAKSPTSAPPQIPSSVQQLSQATIYNPPGAAPLTPSNIPTFSTDIFRPVTANNSVFSVTVTNIETMNTIKDYYKPKTGYKFVTVYLSQQNVSNEVQIYTGRFSMLDQSNTSYDYAEQLSNFWLIILKPGGINFGYLVFEVPQDARPARLLLHALNQAPLSLNL
ncbi:MAG: DUF4352 domain-containing protein [bacterium]